MTKVQLSAKLLVIAAAGVMAACEQPEPPSAIVSMVEKAGLGPTHKADNDQLFRFMSANTQLMLQVTDLCMPLIKEKRGTPWDRTSEGRICYAAQWTIKPPQPRPPSRVFKGGTL
jgi:hypothetical protein